MKHAKNFFVVIFIFLSFFFMTNFCIFSQSDNLESKLPEKVKKEINQYKIAILANPKDCFAHNLLGFVYQENKMYIDALVHYQLAVKFKPDNPLFRNNLGDLYIQLGNYIAAAKQLSIAVKLAPFEPTILTNYARAMIGIHKFKRAYRALKKAIRIDPNYKMARVVNKERKIAFKKYIKEEIKREKQRLEEEKIQRELIEKTRKEEKQKRILKQKQEEQFTKLLVISVVVGVILIIIIALMLYWWNLPGKKIKRAFKSQNFENVIYYFENSTKPISDIAVIEMYYLAIKETTFWKKRLDTVKKLINNSPTEITYYKDLFEAHFMAKSNVRSLIKDITNFEKRFTDPKNRKEIYKHLLTLSTNISGYLKIVSDISRKYFKIEKDDFTLYKNLFDYNLKRNDFKEAEKIIIQLSKIKKAEKISLEIQSEMVKKAPVASVGILYCFVTMFNMGKFSDENIITSYSTHLIKSLKKNSIDIFPFSIKEIANEYMNFLIKTNNLPQTEKLFELLKENITNNSDEIISFSQIAFKIGKNDEGYKLLNKLFLIRPEMSGFIIEKLKEIIEQDSSSPNVMLHYLLAQCYYTMGNINQALIESELAYNYNIKNSEILKFYIKVLIKANIKDKLLDTLEELSKIEEDYFYKCILAEIYTISKYFNKSADIYELFVTNNFIEHFFFHKLMTVSAKNKDWKLIETLSNKYYKKDSIYKYLVLKILQSIKSDENEQIIFPIIQNIFSYEKEKGTNQELVAMETKIDSNIENSNFMQSIISLYIKEGLLEKANSTIIKCISLQNPPIEIIEKFFEINTILGNTSSILKFIINTKIKGEEYNELVIKTLNNLIHTSPFMFESYNLLYKIYLNRNKKTSCIEILEKLLLLNPRDNKSMALLRKLKNESIMEA